MEPIEGKLVNCTCKTNLLRYYGQKVPQAKGIDEGLLLVHLQFCLRGCFLSHNPLENCKLQAQFRKSIKVTELFDRYS